MKAWMIEHRAARWDEVRAVLGGLECAWADIDGWNEAGPPSEAPVGATHLWAWGSGRSVFVRLSPGRSLCVELRGLAEGSISEIEPTDGAQHEQTDVSVRTATVWPAGTNGMRVDSRYTSFDLLTAEGAASVTFVRAHSS